MLRAGKFRPSRKATRQADARPLRPTAGTFAPTTTAVANDRPVADRTFAQPTCGLLRKIASSLGRTARTHASWHPRPVCSHVILAVGTPMISACVLVDVPLTVADLGPRPSTSSG